MAAPAAPAATPETPAAPVAEDRRSETVDIPRDGIGTGGERLTRDEAFDLVRRAVDILTGGADTPVLASDVRRKARDLLGRDSESLNERMFVRVLRDAHDANVVDLRKRGDDWELAPAADVAPIADQLQAAVPVPSQSQAGRSAATAASFRRGMRSRGGRTSGAMELPPELLSLGVVDFGAPAVPDEMIEREPEAGAEAPPQSAASEAAPEEPAAKPRRGTRGRKTARKGKSEATTPAAQSEAAAPAKAKRRRPPRGRAKKPAATGARDDRKPRQSRRIDGQALTASFFDRETRSSARVLGACLVRKARECGWRIVETEAYLGEHEPACHAAGPA